MPCGRLHGLIRIGCCLVLVLAIAGVTGAAGASAETISTVAVLHKLDPACFEDTAKGK